VSFRVAPPVKDVKRDHVITVVAALPKMLAAAAMFDGAAAAKAFLGRC